MNASLHKYVRWTIRLGLFLLIGSGCTNADIADDTGPKIVSMTPDLLPTDGGMPVTISGINIDPAAVVEIGGMEAKSTWISDKSMEVIVPQNPNTLGFVSVTLKNPDGKLDTVKKMVGYYSNRTHFDPKKSKRFDFSSDSPQAMTIGDLDLDGINDIVYAAKPVDTKDTFVGVILGNGKKMSQPVDFNPAPDGISIGDFDEDGNPDVILCDALGRELIVLPGGGSGYFGTAIRSSLVFNSRTLAFRSMAVFDMNKDGKLDVLAVNNHRGIVAVALGRGDGTFVPKVAEFMTSVIPSQVVLADMDGDGSVDMLTNDTDSDMFALHQNKGDYSKNFKEPSMIHIGHGTVYYVKRFTVGDVDGDRRPDVMLLSGTTISPGQIGITLLKNHGEGVFREPVLIPIAPKNGIPHDMLTFDFNGDRKLDLMVLTDSYLLFFEGNGDGTFKSPVDFGGNRTISDIRSMRAADMNGDGKVDLVISNSYDANVRNGSIEILFNTSS